MVQFFQEIQEQPQALLQTANFYKSVEGKSVLSQISELWCSGKYRNILLTGMGSSYFIANATASLLNSYKIPAYALNAGELLHYQISLISPESLIICISQSGESYEVIKLIEKLSSNITVLSICNEIFGEVNFISNISWQKRYTRSNNTDNFTTVIDHIVVYGKDEFQVNLLERDDVANSRFSNPDNDPRGPWKATPFLNQVSPEKRPNLCYPIVNPYTQSVANPTNKAWRYEKKKFEELLSEKRLWWGTNKDKLVPDIKTFLSEVRQGMTPINFWSYEFAGHTDQANAEIKNIFGSKIFDTPKPSLLIRRMIEHSCRENDIILDFFSGSSTTAHAVINMNMADGGKRKFIMVQLPEPCLENSTASQEGYKNICDIAQERIRRAGKKIKEEAGLQGQHLDIGFRVYKLDSSNLRVWNPDADNLELALGSHEKHLLPGRTQEDLLYEILLKQGIELTEDARIRELGGKRVYSLGHGQYYACMETVIPSDQIESLALGIVQWKNEESPDNTQCAVFVIDEAFRSDADKLNFAKILEQHGIPSVKAL